MTFFIDKGSSNSFVAQPKNSTNQDNRIFALPAFDNQVNIESDRASDSTDIMKTHILKVPSLSGLIFLFCLLNSSICNECDTGL